ncbi:CoA transferase [Bradyrhizobium sp. BR 1432]|uniref:CoA transferase n=1 Tax=Bradyrhizobium sp. BR 1432 TaxID=3447966 RepID=UPI003EE4FEC6
MAEACHPHWPARWAADPSLRSAEGRRGIEIERGIESWTLTRDADQAMFELQDARISAGVARLPIDLLEDRHLSSRRFLQAVKRFIGLHPQPSMRIREGKEPYAIRAAAPTLGQQAQRSSPGFSGSLTTRLRNYKGRALSVQRCSRKTSSQAERSTCSRITLNMQH